MSRRRADEALVRRRRPPRTLLAVTLVAASVAVFAGCHLHRVHVRHRVHGHSHFHGADCGHAWDGHRWVLVHHDHGPGCGCHYHDGRWWLDPPAGLRIELGTGHVCTATCTHYRWRGRWHRGHRHGHGCGHRLKAGVWVKF